ncbi:hypothetical protein BHM03_00006191 [Ensete ventricosum]|uniref:Uncharacterized protein n=1 Tax=Ensete ventricosum TaxID=4639 RepID=A0A445MBI2_ENSVE|nr:hypothetical protein BHM03_00006191 [Ensete ventricosum]
MASRVLSRFARSGIAHRLMSVSSRRQPVGDGFRSLRESVADPATISLVKVEISTCSLTLTYMVLCRCVRSVSRLPLFITSVASALQLDPMPILFLSGTSLLPLVPPSLCRCSAVSATTAIFIRPERPPPLLLITSTMPPPSVSITIAMPMLSGS